MAPLAILVTVVILVIAADNAVAGRPPWRAWLASCAVIAAFATVVAVPVVVGHALS